MVAKTLEHDSRFPFKISAGQQVYFSTWITFGVIAGRGIIDTVTVEEGRKCVMDAELAGPADTASK